MSVLNIGQTQNILKSANTEKWTSQTGNVDFETGKFKTNSLEAGFGTELEKTQGKTFGEFLKDSISEVNNIQNQANVAIQKLATGESKNIHETMLMVEQAEIAFKTMNQIRTKVLEAYKEIMRMQI
jgi:flagellar hook-basal body complex protein FliE